MKNIAIKNEVRIDNHKGYSSNPPYFYDSLRNAFGFYFKTFITRNSSYDSYISSSAADKKKSLKILERQFLDEENTVLSIVSFERFFELFIKDLLKQTNLKLSQSENNGSKSRTTWELIGKIQNNTFSPFIPNGGRAANTIPFSQSINRFYDLIEYSKDPIKQSNRLIKKFSKNIQRFIFLDNVEYRETLEFINWYRDKILHNGNRLPTMRLLDFIVTQRIIPITNKILEGNNNIPNEWLYFTQSISGVRILDEMMKLSFPVSNQKTPKKIAETFDKLLLIAHLKELGRANMNMNNRVKRNQATYEYNYTNPVGRGERFAQIEKKKHSNAVEIKKCPCCAGNSLVLYRIKNDKMPIPFSTNIEWVKCYICEYHLRFNVFDLHYFDKKFEKLFDY